MKRRTVLHALPAAGLLAACGQNQRTGQPGSAPQPAGKPVRGGTLVALMPQDAVNFDPVRQSDAYAQSVLNQVVDTLYEIDKDGLVVGRLVERTEQPQPNVYVMTLRPGIKFQDGTDLDAGAVKFNLERHMNTPTGVRIQDAQEITSVEATDSRTVTVTLKAPFAPFLSKLTIGMGFMMNPRAVESLGEALQRDLTGAGSGPFKFVEWRKDTQIVVERNPAYWKKDAAGEALPYLDRIVLKPFPDDNVRLTNLRTGDGDVLINNPPFKDVAELKRSPDLTVNEVLGLGWRYIYLNVEQEPFNNPAVRRAFSYAIDRELLRRVVFFENGRALDTPVPEVIPWAHDKDTHPYLKRDLAKARQELSAAGKSGGVSFTLQTRNNSAEWQQSAELIKDQLKEIGLNMEITPIDFSTLLANGRAGNFQALDLGWSGDVDPDNISSIYLTGAGFNYGRYSSPEMDKFLSDGRMAQERSRRGEIYKQAQKLLFQDQPNIVYYNQPQLAVMRKSVQNYPNNYNGYWGSRDFDKIWKTGGR